MKAKLIIPAVTLAGLQADLVLADARTARAEKASQDAKWDKADHAAKVKSLEQEARIVGERLTSAYATIADLKNHAA